MRKDKKENSEKGIRGTTQISIEQKGSGNKFEEWKDQRWMMNF